jgi:hypothetical protein
VDESLRANEATAAAEARAAQQAILSINTNTGNTINTNTGSTIITNTGNTINTNTGSTITTNTGNTINTNTGSTINTNTGARAAQQLQSVASEREVAVGELGGKLAEAEAGLEETRQHNLVMSNEL